MKKVSSTKDILAAIPAVQELIKAEVAARISAGQRIVFEDDNGDVVDSHGTVLKSSSGKAKLSRKAA